MNSPRSTYLPRRSPTTHSEILNDEVCIYEWTTRRVHALNATAARVWQMCDGRTTVGEMATELGAELGVPHADELVWLALGEFKEKLLIEAEPPSPPGLRTLSRRAVMVKLGLTASMLPVVTSIVAPSALQAASLQSQTFSYTGAAQTFTVPPGVTSINVDAYGASGGAGQPALSLANRGGRVQCTLTVAPGESLTVNVGGAGEHYFGPRPSAGGFNGGGTGGVNGGGGGGASDVRRGATKLVVAGGGGGTGSWYTPVYTPGDGSSHGGGLTGATGATGTFAGPGGGGGGGGGTQSAGGAGGAAGIGGSAGGSGSAGSGGPGAGHGEATDFGGGGAGGGGYFGGGGGGSSRSPADRPQGGSGGGGSSYTDPGATSVIHTQGVGSGGISADGQVTFTW